MDCVEYGEASVFILGNDNIEGGLCPNQAPTRARCDIS